VCKDEEGRQHGLASHRFVPPHGRMNRRGHAACSTCREAKVRDGFLTMVKGREVPVDNDG